MKGNTIDRRSWLSKPPCFSGMQVVYLHQSQQGWQDFSPTNTETWLVVHRISHQDPTIAHSVQRSSRAMLTIYSLIYTGYELGISSHWVEHVQSIVDQKPWRLSGHPKTIRLISAKFENGHVLFSSLHGRFISWRREVLHWSQCALIIARRRWSKATSILPNEQ